MQFKSSDPDELQGFARQFAGCVSIRPTAGPVFEMDFELFQQGKLGIFFVDGYSYRVHKEPPHEFYSLNIPLHSFFTIEARGYRHTYGSDSAYLLNRQECFDISTSHEQNKMLVLNLFDDQLQEKTCKLLALEDENKVNYKSRINLHDANMSSFLRSLANTISEIKAPSSAESTSEMILQEREDELITRLILASQHSTQQHAEDNRLVANRLMHVEEYLAAHLDAPVERWKLAEIADTSIRNLSRCFMQRYGMGPMAFLKQRRLDMTYLQLLGAEPDEVAVTDIAMKYGFNHLGRFAAEFSRTFGESPSTTLHH